MYGRDMGALKIKMRSGSKEKVLWEKSGNQGNEWKQLEVSLESVTKYNVSDMFQEYSRFCIAWNNRLMPARKCSCY